MDQSWNEQERRRLARLCAVLTGDSARRRRPRPGDPARGVADPAPAGRPLGSRPVARRDRPQRLPTAGGSAGAGSPPASSPATSPATCPGRRHAGPDEMADLLDHEELVDLLDRVLSLVPAETRAALVARYVDELAPQEIARRLALTPEAVSMRLTRGRARIRELLETELAEEPLAQVWVSRHGAAWRPTRLSCPTCGRRTTQHATRPRRRRGPAPVRDLRARRSRLRLAARQPHPRRAPGRREPAERGRGPDGHLVPGLVAGGDRDRPRRPARGAGRTCRWRPTSGRRSPSRERGGGGTPAAPRAARSSPRRCWGWRCPPRRRGGCGRRDRGRTPYRRGTPSTPAGRRSRSGCVTTSRATDVDVLVDVATMRPVAVVATR